MKRFRLLPLRAETVSDHFEIFRDPELEIFLTWHSLGELHRDQDRVAPTRLQGALEPKVPLS